MRDIYTESFLRESVLEQDISKPSADVESSHTKANHMIDLSFSQYQIEMVQRNIYDR